MCFFLAFHTFTHSHGCSASLRTTVATGTHNHCVLALAPRSCSPSRPAQRRHSLSPAPFFLARHGCANHAEAVGAEARASC